MSFDLYFAGVRDIEADEAMMQEEVVDYILNYVIEVEENYGYNKLKKKQVQKYL